MVHVTKQNQIHITSNSWGKNCYDTFKYSYAYIYIHTQQVLGIISSIFPILPEMSWWICQPTNHGKRTISLCLEGVVGSTSALLEDVSLVESVFEKTNRSAPPGMYEKTWKMWAVLKKTLVGWLLYIEDNVCVFWIRDYPCVSRFWHSNASRCSVLSKARGEWKMIWFDSEKKDSNKTCHLMKYDDFRGDHLNHKKKHHGWVAWFMSRTACTLYCSILWMYPSPTSHLVMCSFWVQ